MTEEAEQQLESRERVVDRSNTCRLWTQICCTYGDKCQFSHDGPGGLASKKGPCHWWAQYACPFGEKCKFSHEGPGSLVEKKPKKPLKCRDYRKGKCKLGDQCPFSHDFVPPTKECIPATKKDDAEKDCINWKTKGKCSRKAKGTCPYRHDPARLEILKAKKAKRQQSKKDDDGDKKKIKKQKISTN